MAGAENGLAAAYQVLTEVAAAVSLQEGDAGVGRVLRVLAMSAPLPSREVARATGLPVPVVAAVQNELRSRAYLTRDRPGQLTGAGRELARTLAVDGDPGIVPRCPTCAGHQVVIPDRLRGTVDELAEIAAAGPAVELALDQSHCTAETKVRRVVHMLHTGGLPTPGLLAVGDDDLVALAVLAVGRRLGIRLAGEIGVLDISADVLDYIGGRATGSDVTVLLQQHDLREELPADFAGRFTAAMTDPPYTVPGAALFLSRARQGLRPGPGRDVYFHFGPKGPGESLELAEVLVGLGLATSSMIRNFSSYAGSGVLGGVSHVQHLVTAGEPAGVRGRYAGPLYTAETRNAGREYHCTECGYRVVVQPNTEWPTVAAVKQAGCPRCANTRFRPGHLIITTPPGAG